MNRPLDRSNLEVLSVDECLERLADEPVGRVAYVSGGELTILPVTYLMDDRNILFRVAHGAALPDAALAEPVAFEVDGYDTEARTGWSVLVRGHAEEINPADVATRLDGSGFEPWTGEVGRDQWVRLHADEITGRRIPDRS